MVVTMVFRRRVATLVTEVVGNTGSAATSVEKNLRWFRYDEYTRWGGSLRFVDEPAHFRLVRHPWSRHVFTGLVRGHPTVHVKCIDFSRWNPGVFRSSSPSAVKWLFLCTICLIGRFGTRKEIDELLLDAVNYLNCLQSAVKLVEMTVQDLVWNVANCSWVNAQWGMFGVRPFLWISVVTFTESLRWLQGR